mgnify:CR=1 FL=1
MAARRHLREPQASDLRRSLSTRVTLLGVMIAVIAFVLSFDALRLVFVSSGINPLLSWGGPLCVDGTILLCTWATWGFKKGHIRGSAYPWVGLVLFSSFSIAGNALHAMLNTGFHLPAWVPPVIMSIHQDAFIAERFRGDGVIAAVSVLAHEVPHHIGDLVVMRLNSNRNAAVLKVSLAGAVTAFGGLVGYFLVGQLEAWLPFFLVVASSSFVYVALADLIPQLQKRLSARETLAQIVWLLVGMGLVMLVSGAADRKSVV